MRFQHTHHRPPNAALFLLLATLCAACADPATSIDREPVDRPVLSVDDATEFVINDEQWIDRTVEEESVEIPVGDSDDALTDDAPSDAVQALIVETEPRIRVGVVYSELNATTVRLGGRDNADTYSLRSGSVTGTVLAAGITGGEVVATRLASGPSIRLTLPGGATITTTNAVALVSASGFVRVRRTTGDASIYRGTAEIRFNSTKAALVGVNVLPIEQYVYGVVPRELPPVPYGQPEAQKSQAIAARTFARRRMQFCGAARCGHGYHVVPTTSDQVYGGFTAERAVSTAAVDGTRGLVATHKGALIETLYSSTSGGFTANSGDVFINQLPYLIGVPDHERGQALQHVPSLDVFRRHAHPTSLRNHANGDFEADWSIYHRWYVDWTKEEMRQVVGRIQLPTGATFVDPGEVYAIDVVKRSSSGRVFEMAFVTEKRGTLVARKDAVRTALRYVTYSSPTTMVFNSLRSTLVYIEPVIDPKTKALVGWEAWGGGWGHGTGMSQTGASGMAEKGHTFREILGHYYQGVVLEQRWE